MRNNKKKTHDEYVAELAIANPNVEVVGMYTDAKTKIEHHCLLHDVYWDVLPNNVLKGKGCRECRKEKNRNNFVKSHEEYTKQVEEINPNIVVLEHYIDSHTPILHWCKKHDIKWKPFPTNILKGYGCEECGNEKIHDKRCRKHDEYVAELAIKNPTVEVVEDYIDSQTPIVHHCLIHDIYWKIKPNDALRGRGCKICWHTRIGVSNARTHEQYVAEVLKVNPNIKVIGQYINSSTLVLHKCTVHNIEWMACPYYILQGCGCRMCGNEKISEKQRKTHEQYVKEVNDINSDIEVVGQYIDSKTPILHKCKIDGYTWMAIPQSILYGYGCPQCNESSGERQVRQWLNKNNIQYEYQKIFKDCRNTLPLPFDFYLIDYNVAIEYQGRQHYFPIDFFGGESKFQLQQKNDNIKREYCGNNNIKLLEVPYFENVEEKLNNFLFI